ncbi:MAG: fibronectin type III domain-containing protein, partial [Bacteroidales bacterium]|nr:fibronectin type III domain-containing protein [Bacteroidales bacterium]
MKRLLFFLMAIIFAIQGFSQTTVTIGSGTSTSSSGSIPGFYGFHNSALLFTASEMTQGGVIESFGLEIGSASSTSTRSMKIYLKEVSDASLATSQIMNNLLDGATLVYDSTNVNCSTTGWRNFVFASPFNYSGVNNLLVIITGSGCSTSGGCSVSVKYSTTPAGKAWTKVIDYSNIDFSTSVAYTNTNRYNSRFIMTDLPLDFCFPPANFLLSSLTSTGVNLSWTSNSSPDSYTVEYKPSNSSSWITINSPTNSYSFTGLNPATTYNVRVKSNCSSLSSTSIWSYLSFLTACDQISVLPYLESFDSYGTGTGSFPICWSKVTSNTNPYISTTNSSSPGSMYMYTASGAYNYIVTPEISMSIPINTLSAFFKLYKGSADYNITVGVMSDPTNISTFDSLKNLTPTTISTWQTFDVDFANYTGLGKYIAFKVQGYGAANGMYIDDIEIIETPACAIPIGLTDLSSNTNSITLDWDAADDANVLSWIVEYKPIDSSEWLAQSAASHPFVLSGLLSGVVYQIRLYAICSDGDTTNATNTINVGMPCETISSFPWYEGFENTWFSAFGLNTGTRPWCWTNINGGEQANGVWRKTTSSSYIRTGSGALQMYSGSTSAGLSGDWFISPTISLTGNQILRFWAKGYSSYTDILTVKILNVTNNGSVAQESDTSLFVDIMPNTIIPASDWVEYEVNLGQFSGDYQIAFVRNTTGGYNLNIDDISITELPICARPTNVAINSLNSTEAEIKWISGHSGDASWYLYYKTNFDQFYDSILVNTNPYTLQNLIPQATYTYYLRTKCGTELSDATNIFTFTTPCQEINTFPWNEGFEGIAATNELPPCWSATNLGSKTYTQISNYGSYNRNAR